MVISMISAMNFNDNYSSIKFVKGNYNIPKR